MKSLHQMCALLLVLMTPSLASAQAYDAMPLSPQVPVQQIDQMVAPIALYPDELVAQILMASTYPLEIVEAMRWLQNPVNARLQGDQLAATLDPLPWDPSVKSLVPFPQVLQTLNQNIEWTEQLGNAFLIQPADVTNAIQQLRYQAEEAGALESSPQQVVYTQGSVIRIEPTNPNVVYIPIYNPDTVYGDWPYPDYQPYYFSNGVRAVGYGVGFASGVAVVGSLWAWNRWDWRHHRIDVDNKRFARLNEGRQPEHSGVWQHDIDHRHGVPYANPALQTHYGSRVITAAPDNENYRGYEQRHDDARPFDVRRMEERRVAGPRPVDAATVQPMANRPVAQPQVQPQIAPQQRQEHYQRHEQYREIQPSQYPRTPAPVVVPRIHEQAQVLRQAPQPLQQQPVQHVQVPSAPRAAPVFESFARGAEVRQQQERGFQSRGPMQQQNHPSGYNAGPDREHERH